MEQGACSGASAREDGPAGLQLRLLSMGGLVEEAIEDSARAVQERDEELAARVIARDAAIDGCEREVTERVITLLERGGLGPGELRALIAALRMAGNLERIGDHARNTARRVPGLSSAPAVEEAGGIVRRLARAVRLMLKDALDAAARGDAELAADVRLRDVEIDELSSVLFRVLVTRLMEDPRQIGPCMHLMFIAKNLERMGDHVTNIAEEVIRAATGRAPEGDRPRGASTGSVVEPVPGTPPGPAALRHGAFG